jgi:hypothetical protein
VRGVKIAWYLVHGAIFILNVGDRLRSSALLSLSQPHGVHAAFGCTSLLLKSRFITTYSLFDAPFHSDFIV